jgi:hypothetical protein
MKFVQNTIQFAGLGLVASTALVLGAAPAKAQSTHDYYLGDLYDFLAANDQFAYTVAMEIGHETNVMAAQELCIAYSEGLSPTDAYSWITTSIVSEATRYDVAFTNQQTYALNLYVGSVMNLGAAYYCPEYQPSVERALSSF